MIEYLVGGNKPKQRLTPNSVPISSILFTENYSKIIFHMFYEENTNNLCAVEIDNDIIIGTKYTNSKPLEISLGKNHNECFIFDSMEIQEVIKQAGDDKSLYWSNITYLKISYQGNEYILGEKKPVGLVKLHDAHNVLLEYDFLQPIFVSNPFFISGVITHNAGISSFQIIEFNNSDDLEKLYNDSPVGLPLGQKRVKNHIFYNCGKVGIIEGSSEPNDFELKDMIMNHNVISYENIKPIQLLQTLYERMRNWTNGRSVISTYYPKFLSLIDEAMIEREFDVIHSVLRLERYLKSLIMREDLQFDAHKKYQEDLGLTVKLYNVWKPLSDSMKLVQKIHNADIELNCYQIAYLSNDKIDLVYAVVTIICQMGLLTLLGLSLLEVNIDTIFPLYEGKIIIPIIFAFTEFIVQKQMTNTLKFLQLFPDAQYTFLGVCDLFSNVICAALVLFLNFFVLAYSDSLMDIVLNSLAALFIIELDDAMVFISNNAKDDLYKQKVISFFNQSLKDINEIYFGLNVWKHHGIYKLDTEKFEVNRELCTIDLKENMIAPEQIKLGSPQCEKYNQINKSSMKIEMV